MELRIVFTVIIVFWESVFAKSGPCRGYRFCACNRGPKSFRCSHLDYIPRPPNFIQTVELYDNFFHHITRKTFSNLTSNRIKTLILKHNLIQTIEPDSFADLEYIEHFEISCETNLNLKDMRLSFASVNKANLKTLRLEQNGWIELPNNVFENFKGTKLSIMSLNDNKLSSLNSEIVRPFDEINKFYCRNNTIKQIKTENLQSVIHLDLSDNDISIIPSFCHTSKSRNFSSQNLVTLVLTNNAIRKISIDTFFCLEKLKKLALDGNRIRTLHNNVFSSLENLMTLSLSHMPQINFIYKKAFNISTLRILRFVHNGFSFQTSERFDNSEVFKYLTNLEKLDLTGNSLPCHNMVTFKLIISPLKNLKELILQGANVCLLPDSLFQMLPNIRYMDLIGNKITSWNDTLFQNVRSLQKLNLQGNLINIINETSFPEKMLSRLHVLNLEENPYWCTCDQKWFLDTLRNTNLTKKMPNWPHSFNCYYPEHLRFTLLTNYYPTYTECYLISIIIIGVSASGFLIFVFIAVILRCQINIKNALYYIRVYRRMKSGYLKLETAEDFNFDAFVVYCDSDRIWVHNELLKRLESSDLKICVHHRDFDAGVPITNNVENYMDKSWKIIVVMSNEFAKSEWCQWEIDLVLERRRKQGKQALVLVMLKQIDSRHMTSSLRTLLDTTPHLTVVKGFGEQLFWKTIERGVCKPISHPPTAVL